MYDFAGKHMFVIFYWSIPGYTSLGFPCGLAVKNLPAVQETRTCSFSPWVGKIPLEKGMASHSSILAWRIRVDRGAWWATLHGVPKESDTPERLSNRYDVMCQWCHVGFVSLSSLGLTSLVASTLLQMASLPSFRVWVVVRCMYVLPVFYLFSCRWAFRLSPCLGCCEPCCCEHTSACISELQFSLGISPGVGLLDHTVTLVFWGPSILFSPVAAPAFVPISSVGQCPFLHTLSSDGHSGWCEVVPHCSFNLHFSNN